MYKIKLKIRQCKNIDILGKFMKLHDIRLVLFGEYHGFFGQMQVQRKIIQSVQPDFFLYELLEEDNILNNGDAKRFLGKLDSEDFSVISTYGQLKPIIKLARSFSLPVIGCDIKDMCCKSKEWKKNNLSHKEKKEITRKRELRQAKVINQYVAKGVVFGLLGAHHLRKNSIVLSKLRIKKAVVVKPSFRWEERFNDPKKFSNVEISYSVEMVNFS